MNIFRNAPRRGAKSKRDSYGNIASMETKVRSTRKASGRGRPSKGQRHAFVVKLAPDKADKINLIVAVTAPRHISEVAQVITSDALKADRTELRAALQSFAPYKGERESVTFQMPIADAQIIFELRAETGRTYQDIVEYLLGVGLEDETVYNTEEMQAFLAGGQGMLDIAV